jgi:hypothetical protein
MLDGQSQALSGAFTTVAPSTMDVDWKASEFDAAVTACNPTTTLTQLYFGGSAQPYPEDGPYTASPDTFQFLAPDATDFAATLTFNNPFPTSWSHFATAGGQFGKQYALPSAQPVAVFGRVEIRILASGQVTLKPLVGCVQNATVGGQNAVSDITGVGVTPTVSFDAPAVGTSTGYEVVFTRLANSGGKTTSTAAGRIVTAGTSVVVPPGLMTAGNAYVITIRSNVRGNVDMNRVPSKYAFPGAAAEFLSGIVRP